MLDHDTDVYYKISRAVVDKQPSGGLTRDNILDNITLYWLTGTGASAARSYWENTQPRPLRPGSPVRTSRPGRLNHVPRRDLPGPAQLGRDVLPHPGLLQRGRSGRSLRRWEEPELFATEVRAALRLRLPQPALELRVGSPGQVPRDLTTREP